MCRRLLWKLGWLTLGLIIGMAASVIAQAQETNIDSDRLRPVVDIGLARPAVETAEARHILDAFGDGEGFSKLHPTYASCVAELTAWATKAGRGGICFRYRGDGK